MNIQQLTETAVAKCDQAYATHNPADVCFEFVQLCTNLNRYLEQEKPWALKEQPDKALGILYPALEALRIISVFMYPIIPATAHAVWDQLNWKMDQSGQEKRFSWADTKWGMMPAGHPTNKPWILFPRIQTIAKEIEHDLQQ